uniref:Titin n=1 Tax=Ciona savignyi TaxID=51511 RepID=H2YLF3_CIOSA
VTAVNKAGLSEPAFVKGTVVVKEKQEAPEIEIQASMSREQIIKSGLPMSLSAIVRGNPFPTITWNKNDEAIATTNERFKRSVKHGIVKIETDASSRNDSGRYSLTAENGAGKKTVSVIVNVLDTPSAPLHVRISEVRSDSCYLKWKAPSDNGGAVISSYKVERYNVESKVWKPGTRSKCKVPRLIAGKEYLFRVSAENKHGISDPLVSKPEVAKHTFDVPEAPGVPEVSETTETGCTLHWSAPVSDGGSAILGYTVERLDKDSGRWAKVTHDPLLGFTMRVKGLFEGKQYAFRVTAENHAGLSKPSEQSPYIKALRPMTTPGAPINPKILTTLTKNEVLVRAGTDLILRASMAGRPVPVAVWKLGDVDLFKVARSSIKTTEDETRLTISNATRADCGHYVVTATNKTGSDSASAQVNVLDKPAACVGPLKIISLNKDRCTVAWEPPADNGGCEITNYTLEKCETSRMVWSVVTASSIMDRRLNVLGLSIGYDYQFRVAAENEMGVGEPSEPSKMVTIKEPTEVPGPPSNPKVVDTTKNSVTIKWGAPAYDGGARIIGYIVESSVEGLDDWRKCNVGVGTPKTTEFTVTGLRQEQTYVFRVAAVNEVGQGKHESIPGAVSPVEILEEPEIDLDVDMRKNIEIKAGSTLRLLADVKGRPKPTVKWTKLGATLSRRADVDVTDLKTTLVVPETNRDDSGKYTLTASNAKGSKSANINVRVLDVPGMPEGPAKFSNVLADRLKLIWNPPLEDGGAAITNYVIERRETSRPTWAMVSGSAQGTELTVQKLIQNHEYEFRISAENKYGIGQSLVTEPIIVKNPFSVPSAAEPPSVSNAKKEGMTVSWKSPSEDGGKPISGYYLEKRETKAVQWAKVNRRPVSDRSIKVTGLIEGAEYEFRVAAENVAGIGEFKPSAETEATSPVEIIEPPMYELDADMKQALTVRAGGSIRLFVTIKGRPTPTATWTKEGGNRLEDSNLLNIVNTDSDSVVHIRDCKRSDSGAYSIDLKNIAGSRSLTVSLKVLDRPGPPENIAVTDVTSSRAKLTWSAPRDDGGAHVTHYVVEKRETSRLAWTLVTNQVEGTSLRVSNLLEQNEYVFRVMGVNKYGQGEAAESQPLKAENPFTLPCKPTQPEPTGVTRTSVDLIWRKPENDGGAKVSGYVVERRELPNGRWLKCNFSNLIDCKYTVTGLTEDASYEFQVTAKNASGSVSAPSEPSEKVTCKDSFTPPRLDLNGNLKDTVVVKAGETITLSASIFGKPVPTATWTRNNVELDNTPKTEIMDTGSTASLSIKDSTRDDSGDYVLHLKNTAGSRAISITVKVLDRPGQPIGPLTISEVTSERCRLAWRAPENNGGAPVTHYNIEKRETSRLAWTLVESGIEGVTTKVHRLLKGNEYIFRVIAVNKYGLGVPLESVPVIAKDPFSVPAAPGKPQVSTVMRNSAVLTWTRPTSDGGSDISGYHIERKERNSLRWTRAVRRSVPSLHHKEPQASITNLKEGQEYAFRVIALNEVGASDPREASSLVVCHDDFQPPMIQLDTDILDGVNIRAGVTLRLKANVTGKPAPKIVWTRDGKELVSNAQTEITKNKNVCMVTIKDTTRLNSGCYVISARNPCATKTMEVKVLVLDKPGPPEGPVKFTSLTQDKVTLWWGTPKDTGGSTVESYVVEKRETTRLNWALVTACSESTNQTVNRLIKNHEYQFRISAQNKYGVGTPLLSEPVVAKVSYTVPDAPGQPQVTDTTRSTIALNWTPPMYDGGS